MSLAVEALDRQIALRRWFHPSNRNAWDFVQGIAYEMSGHLEKLEEINADALKAAYHLTINTLQNMAEAPVYAVSKEMLEVIALGADQLVEEKEAPSLDRDWLPTPSGFVHFETAIEFPASPEGETEMFNGLWWGHSDISDDFYQFGFLLDNKQIPDGFFKTLQFSVGGAPVPYGKPWIIGKDGDWGEADSTDRLRYFLIALWSLMTEKVVIETNLGRPARKRAERAGIEPAVRVVYLRKHVSTASGEPGTGTKLHTRFVVSGHWRNQAYGEGRSLRKRMWINPYIKGPEDAPLTVKRTIRVLMR